VQATQFLRVALDQSVCATPLVLPAKLLGLGRIAARLGAVAHSGDFRPAEQAYLPHPGIISHRRRRQ